MFVYGVRCAPNDLLDLPEGAVADYYLDYGLLIFPSYTVPSSRKSTRGTLSPQFWSSVSKMMSGHVHVVEREHPWITPNEDAVVRALTKFYPTLQTEWYYVPKAATQESGLSSEDD